MRARRPPDEDEDGVFVDEVLKVVAVLLSFFVSALIVYLMLKGIETLIGH